MTKTATTLSMTHSYCNHHVRHGERANITRFNKPCIHAAACVKYGCKYAHPPGRKPECRFGYNCTKVGCPKLHPRPKRGSQVMTTQQDFFVGQQVQAQYNIGATWRLANVCCVKRSCVSLRFNGWQDVNDIPLDRVRHVPQMQADRRPASRLSAFISRGAAVTSPQQHKPNARIMRTQSSSKSGVPRKPRPSAAVQQLQALKQAAVAQENFLMAADLKQQIQKVVELEVKKTAAVNKEDFLAAMQIKKQIEELTQAFQENVKSS